MKKLLLLTAVSAMVLPALADAPAPLKFEDANVYAMSPNGEYLVSWTMLGTKIYNLSTGQMFDYTDGSEGGMYGCGLARCVSDDGVVVGAPESDEAMYWKGGEWYPLQVPANCIGTSYGNSITPDSYRICGSISTAELNMDDDTLMLEPCVWTWDEAASDYGKPVMLPHPELDFSGRIPMYISAIDISADGKTVIGQVRTATGMLHYPIVYTENEDGEWTYKTLFEDQIIPDGVSFPEYPGDDPTKWPELKDFMTSEEQAAYDAAYEEWILSGYTLPFPEMEDYMTSEEKAAYDAAYAEALASYAAWYEKFEAWMNVHNLCMEGRPDFEFNSIRIAPDGKSFANTMNVEGEVDPDAWFPSQDRHIYIYDIDGQIKTKYDQDSDLTLTYLGYDDVVLASSASSGIPQAYVLANGNVTSAADWISARIPEYGTWLDENLKFYMEAYIPSTGEYIGEEIVLTGRAYATPDLSKIALGTDNYWDYMDNGLTCVFDMKTGTGVGSVAPADEGEKIIYDLSGRRLKSADAPGIYIINGEKKAVR